MKQIKLTKDFDIWFSNYLRQDRIQIQRLLDDGMATRFLIAWSLFESKCFNGYVKIGALSNFARNVSEDVRFMRDGFELAGRHFHERYQDKKLLSNLLYGKKVKGLSIILEKPYGKVDDFELLYFLLIVIYRYRNNIFHGNKGVDSWLQYRRQIQFCLDVMQQLISIREPYYNTEIQATA